jgi:cytochrome c
VLPLVCALVFPSASSAQEEQATPEEVVQKVKAAADYLSKSGEAGLEQFESQGSEYVWKDTYVVVNDCDRKQIAAHPVRPELAGAAFVHAPTFEGVTGEQVGAMLCEAGGRPQGGWVEYPFPKPGEEEPSRKISYARAVEGTPYVVNGGIYSEDAKIEELDELIGK